MSRFPHWALLSHLQCLFASNSRHDPRLWPVSDPLNHRQVNLATEDWSFIIRVRELGYHLGDGCSHSTLVAMVLKSVYGLVIHVPSSLIIGAEFSRLNDATCTGSGWSSHAWSFRSPGLNGRFVRSGFRLIGHKRHFPQYQVCWCYIDQTMPTLNFDIC